MSDVVTVGEIRGKLTLDDSQWSATIDKAQAQAEGLGKSNPKITVDADTAAAGARLDEIRAQTDKVAADKITIGVDIDAGKAEAELAAFMAQLDVAKATTVDISVLQSGSSDVFQAFLQAEQAAQTATGDLGSALSDVSSQLETVGSEGESAFSGLLSKVSPLPIAIGLAATAIGPLVAAAAAGGTEIIALAGTAALAYEGMKTDMANATTEGVALMAGIAGVSGELHDLESVAASALEDGVLGSLNQIKTALPALDPLVGKLGAQLGAALEAGTAGGISALTALEPLLDQAGTEVDRLAGNFETFAAGPEFKQFVAYAEKELPRVEEMVESLGEGTIKVATALAPIGDLLIDAFTGLGTELNGVAAGLAAITKYTGIDWLANQLGLIHDEVTDASVALSQNLSNDAANLAKWNADAAKSIQDSLGTVQDQYGLTSDQADKFTSIVGLTSAQVTSGAVSLAAYRSALGEVAESEDNASQSGSAFLDALTTFSQSADTAADKGALIGATLKASQGDALDYQGSMLSAATANQQFVTDFDNARFAARDAHTAFDDATSGVVDLTTGTLNYHNAAAGPLISDLQSLQTAAANAASAVFQHEVSLKGAGEAATDAATVFKSDTSGALQAEAKQLGLTSAQAKALADEYFSMPASVTTTVRDIGLDDINTTLGELGQQLSYLTHVPWTVDVGVDASGVGPTIAQVQAQIDSLHGASIPVSIGLSSTQGLKEYNDQHPTAPLYGPVLPNAKASGGFITGPGTGTSDTAGIFALSNGEHVDTADSVDRNAAALAAGNAGATLAVVPGMADGGFVGVTAPTDPQVAKNASASKAASTAAATKATQLAKQQATVKVEITSDVAKVLGATLDSVDAVQSSFSALLADVSTSVANGVGSKSLITTLERDNNQLAGLATNRAGILAQLTAAQNKYTQDTASYNQEKASVSSGITGNLGITNLSSGSFDPFGGVSANGSISDTISLLQSRVQQGGDFKNELATLQKMGLSPALIQQLADAGVSGGGASAAQLVGASKAQIAQINALSGQINTYGSTAGTQIAKSAYSATISGDITAVNNANQALIANQKAAAAIASAMAQAFKSIGINVTPSVPGFQNLIKAEITQNNSALAAAGKY